MSPNTAPSNNGKHVLSHTVSEGQESGRSLAGCFWLRVSWEAAVKWSAGARGAASQLTHWLLRYPRSSLTVDQRLQSLKTGHFYRTAGCFPQREREEEEREGDRERMCGMSGVGR